MVTYRYELTRRYDNGFWGGGCLCWVMLNPSTADEETDDPTIRRVRGFTVKWGFDSLVVVNMFAMRATNPDELRSVPIEVAIGGMNDHFLSSRIETADAVVAAWGSLPSRALKDWVNRASQLFLPRARQVWCLGLTKTGDPRHPLFVAGETMPKDYATALEEFAL